ncbi:hypothetical protein JG688_00011819 [Phytophthora aleatoria]|uniref:RGS domain-containing protein n=1 Tax=Phytophthora aleatoria TaxID=2496075 RepID=A0A8J5ISL6_9STRA|nr:hypothetical protein JG688_00011819 [Phytophthora aleatoria]
MLQGWFKKGLISDEAVGLLSLGNKADDLLTGSLLNAWVSYINVFNKENPSEKMKMISTLTARFGDEALSTMVETAKRIPKTEAIATQVQAKQIKNWMKAGKTPDDVFELLKLNTAKSLLFDRPPVNAWLKYMDEFTQSNAGSHFSTIATLRKIYTDDELAEMIIVAAKNSKTSDAGKRVETELLRTWFNEMKTPTDILKMLNRRKPGQTSLAPIWAKYSDLFKKVDPRFKTDMLEDWLKKGLITEDTTPDDIFKMLQLKKLGTNFLTNPIFLAWVKYTDDFRKNDLGTHLSTLTTLRKYHSDETLAKLFTEASKKTKTTKIGRRLEAELLREWSLAGTSPMQVFSRLNLRSTGRKMLESPVYTMWTNYIAMFKKANPRYTEDQLATLIQSFGHKELSMMLISAEKVQSTTDIATRLRAELFDLWRASKVDPAGVYKMLHVENAAANSPTRTFWSEYVKLDSDDRDQRDSITMGAAASVDDPDASVIFRETKEEYERRIAAGDSKEQIFSSLRDIVATRLDVLTDPTTLKMILKYAEVNKVPSGADMLRFWVEIDELQHLPSHSYTHRRLRKIYDKFLSPEAPSPVCVTAQMLQDIEKSLEGDNISAGIYAGAQQICYIALEKSVYPRFRESKLFRKMQDFCSPIVPNAGASSSNGSGNGPTPLAVASTTGTVSANITDNLEDTEDFSLMGILAHPAKLRFLKTFCMEALALENLLFYLEVEDCKRLPNLSFVVNKTRKIYDRYCSPSSKNFIVGLGDNEALKEIHDVVENKEALVPKLFYEIQISVFNRISDEIWPGFCRSQEYLDHSKEVKPDTKHLTRRGNRFEENEAVQKKLDGLAEIQLIDTAMHYPVEKLIPISFPESIQGAARRKSIQKLEEEQTLTPEQVLRLLLGDPFAKKYLKLFMTRRGVDSLLAFCEEVEDFKLLPGIEFLQHSAKKIYRKYIVPSARLQVDMSTTMRDEIYTRLANPSVDMFKKIANRVRHGMLQDSLPRFVKSNYYKELRRDSKAMGADAHLASVDQAAKAGKLELCHLDVFLTYPGCMQAFRKFLDFQHCSENLMLWEEIEHYRRLPSYQIVLRSAKKIYDKYLNPNNPRSQIPLAPALRQRMEAQLEVACRTTFDEIEIECYDHMRNVVMPDFLDSRIFMALVGTWATVHEDYPAEMLRGELEMAFLRHRFHLVQEARGMSRDSTVSNFEKGRNGATPTLGNGSGSARMTNGG